MSSSVGKTVSRKLHAVSSEIAGSRRAGLMAGSLVLKESATKSLLAVAPSGRLRNVGRGAKLTVGFDTRGDVQSIIRAKGPWQIIERDTKAHTITPRKRGRKAKALGGGLAAAAGGPRASASHPGTKGKHPFEKGIRRGVTLAADAIGKRISTAARKGFAR